MTPSDPSLPCKSAEAGHTKDQALEALRINHEKQRDHSARIDRLTESISSDISKLHKDLMNYYNLLSAKIMLDQGTAIPEGVKFTNAYKVELTNNYNPFREPSTEAADWCKWGQTRNYFGLMRPYYCKNRKIIRV